MQERCLFSHQHICKKKNEAPFLFAEKQSNEFLLSKVTCSYNSGERCHVFFNRTNHFLVLGAQHYWLVPALLRGFSVMFLQNSFPKTKLQLAWTSVSSVEMSLHIMLQASCCNMKMSLQIAWQGRDVTSLLWTATEESVLFDRAGPILF